MGKVLAGPLLLISPLKRKSKQQSNVSPTKLAAAADKKKPLDATTRDAAADSAD